MKLRHAVARVLRLGAIVSTVVACSPDRRAEDHATGMPVAADRADSAGTVVMTFRLGQPDSGVVDAWALTNARLRIDSVPRSQNPELHQLTGAALLANGDLAVGHLSRHEVLVFDSMGQLRATVGREGAGPGEFRSISGPWTTADNRFAVYDGENRRVTIFAAPDSIARLTRIAVEMLPDSSFFIWKSFGVTRAGTALFWVNGAPLKTVGMARPDMSLIAVDSNGSANRVGAQRPGLQQYVLSPPSARSFALGLSPFAASPLAVACGQRVAIADNQSYNVQLMDLSGRVALIIRADTRSRQASDADYIAVARTYRSSATITSDMIAPMKMMTPDGTLPVLRGVFCDDAENVWVEEWPHDGGAQRRVSSYSSEGALRFVLQLPMDVQLLGAKDTRIAVAVVDDDGAERIELRDVDLTRRVRGASLQEH